MMASVLGQGLLNQLERPFLISLDVMQKITRHRTITTCVEGMTCIGTSGPRTLEIAEARIENVLCIP